jgi:carboxymethylenebutenolidase
LGNWISIDRPGLDFFSGYLSVPPSGRGPGLLMIQEIWGVNDHIRNLADQYAADGFVVLAPDVFWRERVRVDLSYDEIGTAEAYRMYRSLDIGQATADLGQAVDFLTELPQVDGRVGVLGFCMGGRLAYSLADNQRLAVGISYYGSGIATELEHMPRMAFPFLFHFANEDHLIPLEEVRRLMPLIDATGDATFRFYEQQRHGFNCPYRAAYSMDAALAAKAATLSFLRDHVLN